MYKIHAVSALVNLLHRKLLYARYYALHYMQVAVCIEQLRRECCNNYVLLLPLMQEILG